MFTPRIARRLVSAALPCLALAMLAVSAAPAAAQKTLRWKLSEGDRFTLDQHQTQKMEMQIGGMAIATDVNQQIGMTWTVDKVDDEGNAHVTQTIDRIRMSMNAPALGMTFDFDSAAPEKEVDGLAALMVPMFRALAGSKITTKINPRGQMSDVELPKEVTDAIEGAAGGMLKDSLEQIAGQGASHPFPEGPVEKGSSWMHSFDATAGPAGKVVTRFNYRYEGEETVAGKTLDKLGIDLQMDFQDGPITVKEQQGQGTAYFDNEAGHIARTEIKQSMVMEIEAAGQTITQKMESAATSTMSRGGPNRE